MKPFFVLLMICVATISVLAQNKMPDTQPEIKKTDVGTPENSSTNVETLGLTFPASAGVVSAPFVVTNGCLHQPNAKTSIGEGGKAIYTFMITNAGVYIIRAIVNAPAMESNSFFLNIDGEPEDPTMIWDMEVTSGFEGRIVTWRGNGTDVDDEFVPKRFKLTEGKHKLLIYGREPETQLKTISIRPAPIDRH